MFHETYFYSRHTSNIQYTYVYRSVPTINNKDIETVLREISLINCEMKFYL